MGALTRQPEQYFKAVLKNQNKENECRMKTRVKTKKKIIMASEN